MPPGHHKPDTLYSRSLFYNFISLETKNTQIREKYMQKLTVIGTSFVPEFNKWRFKTFGRSVKIEEKKHS